MLRKSARAAWLRLWAEVPGVTITTIQRIEQPLYAWLLANDRVWLRGTRYGVHRKTNLVPPKRARTLTAARVLAAMPHLEKVMWGVRVRHTQKYSRGSVASKTGIPAAMLDALCCETPELDSKVKRLLQRTQIGWDGASLAKQGDEVSSQRRTQRSNGA